MSQTSHEDLCNYSGDLAYAMKKKEWEVGNEYEYKGQEFNVINKVNDGVTGLDAYVIQVKQPDGSWGPTIIVYVGSEDWQTDWQGNNFVSATAKTPPQYPQANEFYEKMVNDYGIYSVNNPNGIDAICGNSLGGGLAQYVGNQHGEVDAVTLNPAPMPYGSVCSLTSKRSISNYIIENDVLHQAVMGAGMADRICGKNQILPPGLYGQKGSDPRGPGGIVNNHVGTYGKGYSTASFIPFSIWHANQVLKAGQYGEKIEINAENMALLSSELEIQQTTLKAVLKENFKPAKTELTTYLAEKATRERATKAAILAALSEGLEPTRKKITLILECFDSVRTNMRKGLTSSNLAVNALLSTSGAGALLITLDLIMGQIENLEEVDFSTKLKGIAEKLIDLTINSDHSVDYIVNGLLVQHDELDEQLTLVRKRYSAVRAQADYLSIEVSRREHALAASIAGRTTKIPEVRAYRKEWPSGKIETLDNPFSKQVFEMVEDFKIAGVNFAITDIGRVITLLVTELIVNPLNVIWKGFEGVELALFVIKTAVNSKLNLIDTLDIANLTQDVCLRAIDKIDTAYKSYKSYSDDIQENIKVISENLSHFPNVIENEKSYISEQWFSSQILMSLKQKYNLIEQIIARSELTFGEVAYQMQDNTSRAIDALGDNSAILMKNLSKVDDNLVMMID